MRYFTIIGDMIGSRKLQNRAHIQKEFSVALQTVQKRYQMQIVSPLTITIGDEFQAVLKDASQLFNFIYEIDQSLDTVSLRYGFGIGAIETEINYLAAIGMDGPAFHNARAALGQARETKTHYALKGCKKDIEQRLNILLNWIDISTRNWSAQKRTILHQYRQNLSQTEIAQQISMSQSAISQHINTPTFSLIYRTQTLIQDEINILLAEGKNDK